MNCFLCGTLPFHLASYSNNYVIIHFKKFCRLFTFIWASLEAQMVKHLPAMRETSVQSLWDPENGFNRAAWDSQNCLAYWNSSKITADSDCSYEIKRHLLLETKAMTNLDYILKSKLLCLWDSPGKSNGVGCHALLQGIFLAQGSNPCLLLLHYCIGGGFFTTRSLDLKKITEN